jgi:hypothetical protein
MSQEIINACRDFLGANSIPAEKGSVSKSINSRAAIQLAVASPILDAIRRGHEITVAEMVDASGLLGQYPTRSGLAKSIGDAIGQNHSGLRLHYGHVGRVQVCRENVALLLNKIPTDLWETIAQNAGFESLQALIAYAETLPSGVKSAQETMLEAVNAQLEEDRTAPWGLNALIEHEVQKRSSAVGG